MLYSALPIRWDHSKRHPTGSVVWLPSPIPMGEGLGVRDSYFLNSAIALRTACKYG